MFLSRLILAFFSLTFSLTLALAANAAPTRASTAAVDEGPTFLNGFWRGRGAVIRDGALTQCFYVLTEFRVKDNAYDNPGFKRKCLTAKGQADKADHTNDPDGLNVKIENLPPVSVTAKDGKLSFGEMLVGTYTKDSVDVRFELPSDEVPDGTYIWHGHFTLVDGALVTQEDSVILDAKKNIVKKNIIYGGVLELDNGSPEELEKELKDPK